MANKDQNINLFIAYSRKDTNYLEQLAVHLAPLERRPDISIWYDGKIEAGSVWEEEIKKHLHTADIILMLISANSLASDYFYEKEMAEALDRHSKGKTIVIPVILEPCMWTITSFNELQALPKDGKPVSDWPNASSAYADIVNGVYSKIESLRGNKEEHTAVELPGISSVVNEARTTQDDQNNNSLIETSTPVTTSINSNSWYILGPSVTVLTSLAAGFGFDAIKKGIYTQGDYYMMWLTTALGVLAASFFVGRLARVNVLKIALLSGIVCAGVWITIWIASGLSDWFVYFALIPAAIIGAKLATIKLTSTS